MIFSKKPLWWVKLTHFEYWTWWLFYLPLFPWYLIQAIRAKSLTYFTNVDPAIEYGGFFGESKIEILNQISAEYLPVTIFIEKNQTINEVITKLEKHQLKFPLICKPNVGERGTNVEKIEQIDQLKCYNSRNLDYIIQEFIDFEVELGLMYFKMPNTKMGQVTSITRKAFLQVFGNGQNTIEQLMEQSDRARFQLKAMEQRMGDGLKRVLAKEEILVLEPIGNHCRGTTFLDNNYLINNKLNQVFDKIGGNIDGFHYGRFDLRVKSIDDLYLGKNIKIMELNGVSADPGHIFDPNYKLFKAYKDVASHWKILANISIAQQKLGIKPISGKILWPILKKHFFN